MASILDGFPGEYAANSNSIPTVLTPSNALAAGLSDSFANNFTPSAPALSSFTWNTPTPMADSFSPAFLNAAGLIPSSASKAAVGSSLSTGTSGFDYGSVLGGLLGTGISVAKQLFIAPAVAKANQAAAQDAANLELQKAAATSAIQTQGLVTVVLWGAAAFGIVLILSAFAKKV